MSNWRTCSLVAAAVGLLCGVAAAWELPLNVVEQWGQGGVRRISGGVPLLAGQAKETSELSLAVKDAKGDLVAVPAQFRVLARWWRADNSIRWVLVDLADTLGGFQTKTFYLIGGKAPAGGAARPSPAAAVEENADRITVSTGPAKFVVSKKKFTFLEHAYLDGGEDLLATTPECGGVMEDTFGQKYFGSADTRKVEVLESGPLRVCVRAQGVHKAPEGQGYSRGMYGYDYIMNFYAGSSDVSVDLVITNNFTQSIGAPLFKDASLLVRLAGGANGYRMYGAAPLDGKLAAGESVCLDQDSDGGEAWQKCQGYSGRTDPNHSEAGGTNFTGDTVSFRGYKILKRAGGQETVLTSGDQARGTTHLFNDVGGVIVHMRNFWQQFPKATEVAADGTLRVALFPRECKAPHYLEDTSAKGHELVFHFYSLKGRRYYAADPDKRPWPHVIADSWDYPVYPRPSLEHIAACGALADLGPYTVPVRGFEDYALEINTRRLLMTDPIWGNGAGWQTFGERWQSHGGHSSRGARQPIKEDHYLYSWFVTGGRGWREVGNDRSRNFRDVRCYRIDGQDPFGFADWNAFRKANRSEDTCDRPQPKDAEAQKYCQGAWVRAAWWLPNTAHMTLDLPYARYLLFGDVRSFEDLRIIAAHGGYFDAYTRPRVHRETGWCMRTIARYWELTGDKAAEACMKQCLKNHSALIGKTPLVCAEESPGGGVNWWFTQVYSRGFAITALVSGDPTALDICKTLAVGKEDHADYFCTLFAVLYHLTGEQKYKDAILAKTDGGRKLLNVVDPGDFPATAHWLMNQPARKSGQ